VQATITQPLGNQFVDDPVVDERTGPSDAPDNPDGLHVGAPAAGRTIAGYSPSSGLTIDLSEFGAAEFDCGGVVRHGRHPSVLGPTSQPDAR